MSIELKTVYDNEPYVDEITSNGNRLFYGIADPHGNCQTFSLSRAYNFGYLNDAETLESLKLILDINRKKQMLIDIRVVDKEGIFNKIGKYCLKVHEMPYDSTNGTEMIICLCVLNIDKIKGDE